MKSRFLQTSLVLALFCAYGNANAAPKECFSCSPQCVPAARAWSGVNFPRVEYAKDIPAAAKKAGFTVKSTPSLGKKSAAVIALGSVDHVVAVTKASFVKNEVQLLISHSNWDCKCSQESVRATFSNGKITFQSGGLRGRSIAVRAFIS